MKERSDLMSLFLKAGVGSLSDMKHIYDGTNNTATNILGSNYNNHFLWDNREKEIADTNQQSKRIDEEEIALRQMYAESSFKKNQKSSAGAKGLYGIMPSTLDAYKKETKNTNVDLDDYNDARQVRDWALQKQLKSDIFKVPQSDSAYYAKKLAAYNWGQGNLRKHLKKKEREGVDINNSLDWIEDIPTEILNYINFILRNKDIPNTQYTNQKYEDAIRDRLGQINPELVDIHNNRTVQSNEAGLQYLVDQLSNSTVNFVSRLQDPNRKTIQDWYDKSSVATHKLGAEIDHLGNSFIYPGVQEIDGKLIDFTRPPYHPWAGYFSALERKDAVKTNTLQEAINFTKNYKNYYPSFNNYAEGGFLKKKIKINLEV